MPDTDLLFALTAFAFASVWTPGPNNFMLASSGATFGYRRTVPHALGVALGFPLMLFLVTLGLGEMFRTEPAVRTAVAWVGFAVMLYLAVRIATQSASPSEGSGRPLTFLAACAFQWVNPKAWGMAIGVAATYASGASPVSEAAIACAIFVLAGLTSANAWAAAGSWLRRVLGTGTRLRAFNLTMGALLALSGLWLVLDP